MLSVVQAKELLLNPIREGITSSPTVIHLCDFLQRCAGDKVGNSILLAPRVFRAIEGTILTNSVHRFVCQSAKFFLHSETEGESIVYSSSSLSVRAA